MWAAEWAGARTVDKVPACSLPPLWQNMSVDRAFCSNGCEKQTQVERTLQIDSELLSECFQETFYLFADLTFFIIIFFIFTFLCCSFQPFWLERQRHYFRTFRVWKSINREDSLLCFRAAQKDKSHPFGMQTHRVNIDEFRVSVSTSTVYHLVRRGDTRRGIVEWQNSHNLHLVNDLWGLQIRWHEPEGCSEFSGNRVWGPMVLVAAPPLLFLGLSYMGKS